jgi:hypothetical protein
MCPSVVDAGNCLGGGMCLITKIKFGRKNTISMKYNYAHANDLRGVSGPSLNLLLVIIIENFVMWRLCSHIVLVEGLTVMMLTPLSLTLDKLLNIKVFPSQGTSQIFKPT